jgi:DNA primase
VISVWNTPIAAGVEQILKDLKMLLYSEGLLRDQNNTGSDVMVTCPFHKGGHERKPSCGVSLREKKTPDKTYEAGTVHCYTCGYTADLPTFIKDLLGLDSPMDGFKWLVGRYNYSTNDREEIEFDFFRGSDEKAASMDEVQVEEYHRNLMESERARAYLRGREIIPDVMEVYRLGYDPADDVVLFPVYSRRGEVLFFKSRSLVGKRFFNAKEIDKTAAVYGLYQTLEAKIPEDTEIWLVESEIDALSLISRGILAWAFMGSDISDKQIKEMLRTPYRRFVIATDNDEAGRKGARMIKDKLIPYGFRFFNLRWLTNKKDVNELIQSYGDDFTDYLQRY